MLMNDYKPTHVVKLCSILVVFLVIPGMDPSDHVLLREAIPKGLAPGTSSKPLLLASFLKMVRKKCVKLVQGAPQAQVDL